MIRHRTSEWYRARIGVFTASNFSKLMARPADKTAAWSKSAMNFIEKSVSQIIYDDYLVRPDNPATRWGIRYEKEALEHFSNRNGFKYTDPGFIFSKESRWIGATPDAKIIDKEQPNDSILAEVKCPYNPKNYTNLRSKVIDSHTLKRTKSEYYWQVQGAMWVADADYSYFIVYDPRRREEESLHAVLIERDESDITALRNKVFQCMAYREQIHEEIRTNTRKAKPLDSFW